jgi:hypothetical protein
VYRVLRHGGRDRDRHGQPAQLGVGDPRALAPRSPSVYVVNESTPGSPAVVAGQASKRRSASPGRTAAYRTAAEHP